MELTDQSAPAPAPATASPSSALVSIFYEPSATFARLAARRATWLPVTVVAIASALLLLWYFLGFVDYAWFQDYMLASVSDPAEREQAAKMGMGQQTMGIVSAVGAVVGVVASYAIGALYLLIVAKVKNQDFGFRQGFSLIAWASMPNLLLLPLGALQMLLAADGQVPLEALNPTTLNQLLFHYDATHPFAGMLESLSIPVIWSTVLMVIGYRAWTGASRATAWSVMLFPYVVVYGIWLAYAMSRAA